jgi:beta-galactosidase
MEDLDQAYGYILYRKQLDGPIEGDLVLDELHDYAQIYLDTKLVGTLDRRLAQNSLPLKVPASGAQLDILVENSGRVNFSIVLRQERKGITKQVALAGKPLFGWDIYPLPMTDAFKLPFTRTSCTGPCFYFGGLNVDQARDTFLDTSSFTKGALWYRGQLLGRIWNIGPQQTLYLPGAFLPGHRGVYSIVVFDLNGSDLPHTLLGRDQPILDRPPSK